MKILVITECYPSSERPQYSVFIKQQLDELRKIGHTADVLIPIRGNESGNLTLVKDEVENRYILSYHTDRYEMFTHLIGKGISQRLSKLVEDERYDLIAVHITSDAVLDAAVILGNRFSIPVIQHYHGLNVWKNYTTTHPYRELWHAKQRAKILGKCSAVVGVSNKVSEVIRERIDNIPVHTVHNGVNLDLFYPSEQKEIESEGIKVITVSNLIPIKGLEYLIVAFARMHEKYSNSTLRIIGEGYLRDQLEKQIIKLGMSSAVEFCGRQSYENVAKIMRESDMFVLPSFYEAIGCVYLEAMGCGIPVVGIRTMGIGEVIQDGENGMLAEEKDTESLYEKMMYLADNPEIARKIGQNGRITAQEYTWKASAEVLNKLYMSCVNG